MSSDDVIVIAVWYVYILRCVDNSLYIGETNNLDFRVRTHNDGSACTFTADRRPVMLVYFEKYETLTEAVTRERQLMRWTRAKKEA